VNELTRNAGHPAQQVCWTFCYALLGLASGVDGAAQEHTIRGLLASFSAWDKLMEEGFVLPWRQQSRKGSPG